MRKNLIKLLALTSLSVLLGACSNQSSSSETNTSSEKVEQTSSSSSEEDYSEYYAAVENLTEISLEEAQEKIDKGDSFYLFIGRPTCQYCRIFAPNLANVLEDVDQEVYYVDSDENDIVDFAETYNFKTVPHFGYFSNQEEVEYLEKGSESTVDEIKEILTKDFN